MPPLEPVAARAGALGPALRAVRHRRGLKVGEIARRMGLARRTYEYFEARGRVEWDRLQRFAAATDSDASAVLLGIVIESPAFAARCADNRLAAIVAAQLRALEARLGDDLSRLDPGRIEQAFRTATETLATPASA